MIADLTTQTMTCTYPGGEGATPTCDEAFAYMDCIESACPEGELEAMGQGYMWREKTLEDLQCIDAVEPWAPVTDGSCAINCYDAIMKADELCDYGQLVFTDEWGYEYRYEPFEMNYMFETIGCMFPTPAAAIATVEASFTLNMELPDETTSEFWMFYDILSTTLESFAGQGEEARVMKIGDVMVGWDDDHDGHDHRNLAAADVVVDYKIRIFKTCQVLLIPSIVCEVWTKCNQRFETGFAYFRFLIGGFLNKQPKCLRVSSNPQLFDHGHLHFNRRPFFYVLLQPSIRLGRYFVYIATRQQPHQTPDHS